MWRNRTGVFFEHLRMADLDGTMDPEGPVRVFAFLDAGPPGEAYEIPKFLHIMGEPEALALWSVMRVKLGID